MFNDGADLNTHTKQGQLKSELPYLILTEAVASGPLHDHPPRRSTPVSQGEGERLSA